MEVEYEKFYEPKLFERVVRLNSNILPLLYKKNIEILLKLNNNKHTCGPFTGLPG